jgi:5-methylcytosine-specific restriction endonuclease McrA
VEDFQDIDYWKAITLFGLNAATYKPALASCLLRAAKAGKSDFSWGDLSNDFFSIYAERLKSKQMPQQSTVGRQTKLERIVKQVEVGNLNKSSAIDFVAKEGFVDVVPRFHTIGNDARLAVNRFYEADFGKKIKIKDALFKIVDTNFSELFEEAEARWSLLEGAFLINHSNYNFALSNSIREVYLKDGYSRKPLTHLKDFLSGYQANVCFYCATPMFEVDVDHVLPRQVLQHDQVWNLVLAHRECNRIKNDAVVSPHFIEKLVRRNENIMGSNHPWRAKIQTDIGSTPNRRASKIREHYENVKTVLGNNFWGGSENYNPAIDPFYRRLITKLNGG